MIRLRSYIPTAILAFLIFYFGFQALTGDRGLLSIGRRNATLREEQVQLAALQVERRDLERRAQLLRDDSLSADLLDERARSTLGLADPRDYVIRIDR
ncbi:MAG TPA: septum formation initiator family protein [Caulobacteraceae bacterium]|nr:septum formation initiator family protein [Caulobacteraceae bacterium]